MSHITTFTGKHFDPAMPDKELIDVRDIAHALSFTCRGNGHVKTFFSVGQHCVNCAMEAAERGFSRRVILACLFHDGSEAYMSDVPRPLKPAMPEYLRMEAQILNLIYEKFLGGVLTEEEENLVKCIDDDMLYYDLTELLGQIVEGEEPDLKIKPDYEVKPFEVVENQFLSLYEKYRIKKVL